MLQLKKFPDITVSTREEAREFRPHPEEPRVRLLAREEGSFPCVVGKEFPAFPSLLKRRRSPQERREELQGRATIRRGARFLSPFQGNLFSLHCLDFQADYRLTPRWHVGQPCGKASRESLEGKPQIPLSTRREARHCCYSSERNSTFMPPLETRTDSIDETSGSGTDSTQGLRPQHRWERNPKWPPSNSHGDWPFLRPTERVPEVPVVSREHLSQLEKIQEVLPSRREEAHFH